MNKPDEKITPKPEPPKPADSPDRDTGTKTDTPGGPKKGEKDK